jgi:hypothetical protein
MSQARERAGKREGRQERGQAREVASKGMVEGEGKK